MSENLKRAQVAALLLLACACGDNHSAPVDAGAADAALPSFYATTEYGAEGSCPRVGI